MGWSIGFDSNWNRDIGYGVPAVCDHPKCNAEIHRGLAYVCGGQPYGGEKGCGLFFCYEHLMIGRSEEAEAYIRKRFPRQVTPLREATEAEEALVSEFAKLKAQKKEIETAHEEAANALKVSIGDAEGFLSRLGKVTWKKDKDSVGPDWQAIARALSVYLTAAREIAESAYTVPEWLQHARTEETDKMMEAIRVLKIEDLVAQNQTVTRVGARKLLGPK